MRGNGERIGPQNLPTSSIAGGIWNLLNQQRAQQRGAWPSATPAVVTDPYFMYVPLLLNTTSTNGQQNNTFLDSSTNNFTITRNGTPTQGAFTPYQPSGYWSGYFNGTSDYLSLAASSQFSLTGSFTVECSFYITSNPPNDNNGLPTAALAIYWSTSLTGSQGFEFNITTGASGSITFTKAGSAAGISANYTLFALNTWYHVAVTYNGTTGALYLNGTSLTLSANNWAWTIPSGTPILRVGGSVFAAGYNHYFPGYISNFRIVNGSAIAPPAGGPTAPLTAVTNTSLLTLQSNRFIDNSSNAFAITVNGTPKVQAFQPFAPAASYSAATYGGSGYFGASTQYLTLGTNTAFNPGAGDFTFECWVYAISSPTSSSLFEGVSNGLSVTFDATNKLAIANSGVAYLVTDPSAFTLTNQWVHIAAVRSGTNLSLYKNGSRVATSASNLTNFVTLTQNYIGLNGGSSYFPGYISNLRLVKGTAVYDPTLTTLTVPTTPLTAVSGTSLLTNFTNAGIYDAAWQNDVTTVGDAQASITQYKWSPTSMKFDGTGDYLDILGPNAAFNLSFGNWTIEAWIYRTQTSKVDVILSMFNTVNTNSGLSFYVNASNQLVTDNGVTAALAAGTVPSNQWVYVAIVRSGGTTTGYVNGTSVGTTTQAPNAAQYARIGFFGLSSLDPTWAFNGYIQDLRITKGVARTITTPTAAFPTR